MASFAATGHLSTPGSSRSRSRFSKPTVSRTPTAAATHKVICHASPPSASISSSSFQTPNKPLKNKSNNPVISLNKTLLLTAASTTALFGLSLIGNGGGTGGGFGGGGGGGGGGRGPGNFWSRLFSRDALAKDEENSEAEAEGWTPHGLAAGAAVQLNKLDALKRYKISDIQFFDRRRWATVGNDSFFEMISIKSGRNYNKADLQKELENLTTCGMFEKVELEVNPKPDGTLGVTVSFAESTWQAADRFACKSVGLMPPSKQVKVEHEMTEKEQYDFLRNLELDYKRRMDRARPCLLPVSVHEEILGMMKGQAKVSARLLQKIRDRVQKWYHDNGYLTAQVVNFGNLNTREVVCEVAEGDITQLVVQFLDKMGNECEGNTQLGVVTREIPDELKPGNVFNVEAGKQALRNINSLALFSNIEVNPRPDEKKDGGIVVEIKLKEVEQKSAEVNTEWSIVPAGGGESTGGGLRPTLASILPGGSVAFEHRNIKGLNRSLNGSVTTSNFLNPQDDLSFKLEYVHPYVDGVRDPRNRTFRTSCFNIRKSSPVFTGGPEVEVPPIWVDRSGVKANITENFTRQSKFTYGVVMEEITTRDENSQIAPNGHRVLPNGAIIADGPPTTLSGTGIDRLAFAQANITRDNTKFVNGAIVGERNVFQLDQGLGIGSKFPFFNRHQLTLTRFIPLKQVEVGAGKSPPPVLVLHGHYGGCVGDLPGYDAFTLGGPYSVRGYNMGEIASARNILEVAAELRVPVKKTQVYAFAEHGNDLGSSKDVKGNPTQVYRRRGHGSSYGAGVKLGLVRVEYAVDHNNGTGAMFVRFGERF